MKFVDLGTKALRLVKAAGQGVPASQADLQIAFEACQDMFDAWAIDRLTVYRTLRTTVAVVAGKGSPSNPYTVGTGGNIDIPRPTWLPNAGIEWTDQTPAMERPIDIVDSHEWSKVPMKALSSALPQRLHYDGEFETSGASVGLGHIFLHPVPNGDRPLNLVLYLPTPMSGFADIGTTEYTFPPGYAEALKYQLAKRLAVEFDKSLSPDAQQLAIESFAVIKRPNAKIPNLRADYGLPRSSGAYYDWRNGTITSGRR